MNHCVCEFGPIFFIDAYIQDGGGEKKNACKKENEYDLARR